MHASGVFQDNKIVLFERGCGATVDNSSHISFISSGDKLSDNTLGNVLIADFGQFELSIEDSSLIINNKDNVKIYKSTSVMNNLHIKIVNN